MSRRMNRDLRRRAVSGAAMGALLWAGSAVAQTPPAPVALDEVVVTADRRESFSADYVQAGTFRDARLRDTPLTITVVTKELLEAQQARSVLDAVRNTAGVSQFQINSLIYSNLAIRGIPADNVTNYRLNGVLPVINFIDMPMDNKDRVEVLKGAAGLYYGFATPSGIVNLVTERPTAEPLNTLEIFGDSHGAAGAAADVSRNWGSVAARINAGVADLETGIDRTRGERRFLTGALDWRPNDRLTVLLDAEYIEREITEPTEFVLPAAVNGGIAVLSPPSASKNLGAAWMLAEGNETNLLARVEYRLSPAWSLSAAAGRSYLKRDRRYSSFSGYDLATGAGVVNVALTHGNDYESVIVRADLAGAFRTGPLTHQLLIGASRNTRDTNIPTAVRYSFAQNLYAPVAIPQQPTPPRIIANPSRVEDVGLYVFDRISYGDWLQATLGYRRTDYSDISRTTRYEVEPDSFSYGLMVKPVGWMTLYGNYIEGLESGGIAQQIAVNAGEILPAALSEQKEVGIKLEPRRGLLFTAAGFEIERASSYLNSANVFVQDARARYRGLELSLFGELTSSLSLAISGLYLDAEQVSGPATILGKKVENTPKRSGSAFAEYRIGAVPGLSVSAGVFYVGERAVNALNQAFIPDYATLDLGARYETELLGRPTRLRVYGENVTGKRYWAATGSGLVAQGAPRTVRFSLSASF
ncbi:TonB-dependent siderophore receptor [Phenylobacterium sp. LjRoot225]|uniref:TonB-dependent siderophore receptor n=1 Tax=Phenylobacterium sp. LjRoot225 TaxID=3342285 RepID=UPI003ECDC56D